MGQLGDLSPQASIAVGILVGLLSTSIQSLGLTLQRKSHLLEDDKEEYEIRRPPYKRRRWQLGMGMFVLSNLVGSTIQITTLPLPVLSTLQASGLVFNTAFATLLLKEPFTRFSFIGTILTCTGAALIAVFGAIGEPAHSLPQLLDLLGRKQFVAWMVATLFVVIGTLIFTRFLKFWSDRVHETHSRSKHERSPSASRSKSRRRSLSIPTPYAAQVRTSRLRLLRGLAYALISGILAAHSLLVAKSAVELLVRTIIDHVNQFNSYQSWLILLALIFFALSQLYYLHQGLRLCSTSVLYPFVFCIYNIIAILDGLIYFHQTSRLSVLHACLIALGTVILLSGVLALSWRLDDVPPMASEAQPTPLGPGLGLVSSMSENPSDSPSSPLLPTARPHSSTSAHANESTPLLSNRHTGGRRTAFMIYPPPPETSNPQYIWAELDDSNESDRDVLASLPRSLSPFLSSSALKSRRRSRGTSLSSTDTPNNTPSTNMLWNRTSSDRSDTRNQHGGGSQSPELRHKPPRRAQTLKERTHGERRRSSAPSTTVVGDSSGVRSSSTSSKTRSPGGRSRTSFASPTAVSSQENLRGGGRTGSPAQGQRGAHGYRDRVRGRPRAATDASRVVPSRWDMSGRVGRWWQGQAQAQIQNREEGDERPEEHDAARGVAGGEGGVGREEDDRKPSGGLI
ncbi:hypothetical protein EPUS_05524 [Endocarpon pusillum Z07020]|uniref:Uncharacterized protein n=1 Tax=Endocarpon pusillum (strain Z07020 / HMAS-L-300199) TaxID=1263415 RepID=U1HTB8_ENDPU|nr:uncharacterized protein EPUS_05524 [Endocarpon pusillum Z07020]ERF73820.1 hypothetical protein EPUS_05524 [Endocarpon pusillum Z07020]